MNVSGWKNYIPLCTPALKDSADKVDKKLLVIRTLFVAFAAIGASLVAFNAKVNLRTIAKFVAPSAICIVIGDIIRTVYATTHSPCSPKEANGSPNGHLPITTSIPTSAPSSSSAQHPVPLIDRYLNLTSVFDEIMQLPESERLLAIYNRITFNKNAWVSCFGEDAVSSEDAKYEFETLPYNIAEILNSPCPENPEKKVIETHMLVIIPQTLGGGISLNRLGVLLKDLLKVNHPGYRYISPQIVEDFGEHTIKKSYWVLMLKEPLLRSRGKTIIDQKIMIKALNKKHSYEVPTLIEAITCMIAQYAGFGKALFANNFIRVQEMVEYVNESNLVVVGAFSAEGIIVDECHYDNNGFVAGALQRFGRI